VNQADHSKTQLGQPCLFPQSSHQVARAIIRTSTCEFKGMRPLAQRVPAFNFVTSHARAVATVASRIGPRRRLKLSSPGIIQQGALMAAGAANGEIHSCWSDYPCASVNPSTVTCIMSAMTRI